MTAKQTKASSSNEAPTVPDTQASTPAPTDTTKPAAEVAVASPIDGSPIPATQAQADATSANTQEEGTDGAAQVQGEVVGEAYTGTPTDPYLEQANQAKDDDVKTVSAPYKATQGFRHGFKGGRTVAATKGQTLSDLSAAEAKELTALGFIEKNSQ